MNDHAIEFRRLAIISKAQIMEASIRNDQYEIFQKTILKYSNGPIQEVVPETE